MPAVQLFTVKNSRGKSKSQSACKGGFMELKEEDIVMCTVKKIEGTAVFVGIEGNGEGSIQMSEVAAGRIRNLREYVAPNKKIVCKVMKIVGGNPQLSLRRVTAKEKKDSEERYRKEKNFTSLLKTEIELPDIIIEEIKKKYDISIFIEMARDNSSLLEQFMKKNEAKKIAQMLSEKKEKEKQAKKIFILKSMSNEGVLEIKEILASSSEDIRYLGSSRFSITMSAKEFKEANNKIDLALQTIEKRAKEKKILFEIKEK